MCRFGEYMQYWGKIIGVAVALLMGGGFWGVVLGLLIGHMFDKARSRKMAWFANQRERQALFFATTFEVMGHLTKSKGRVTEADIHRQPVDGPNEPAWRFPYCGAKCVPGGKIRQLPAARKDAPVSQCLLWSF